VEEALDHHRRGILEGLLRQRERYDERVQNHDRHAVDHGDRSADREATVEPERQNRVTTGTHHRIPDRPEERWPRLDQARAELEQAGEREISAGETHGDEFVAGGGACRGHRIREGWFFQPRGSRAV